MKTDGAMTEGYIFVAIGDRYLRMVENFITTLRHFGDERDVYVITEVDDDELFRSARTEFEDMELFLR